MKVVILCGGKGSRLGFETKTIPKPMAKIDKDPIVLHIISYYMKFGFDDFILALGYKGNVIKNYFSKKRSKFSFKVKCVNTGKNTLTGGRLLRLKRYLLKEKNFMLTYGDGLTNQNLKDLEKFHTKKQFLRRPPLQRLLLSSCYLRPLEGRESDSGRYHFFCSLSHWNTCSERLGPSGGRQNSQHGASNYTVVQDNSLSDVLSPNRHCESQSRLGCFV